MYIVANQQYSTNTTSSTSQKIQHYRVNLEAAKQHYKLGLLTATGLTYYAIAIQRSPGWKIKLDAQTVEEELGIKKTAFYNAISKLRDEGLIEWEARRGINAWIPVATNEAAPQDGVAPGYYDVPLEDESTSNCDDLSQDKSCQQDGYSANAERVQICGNNSAIAEPELLEALQDIDSPPLTDIQHIFNQQQNSTVVDQEEFEEEEQPQPSVEEKREIFDRLRQMGVKLNWTVQHTVANYFANVINAITHIKERLQSGENFRCLEAAFVKACKEGAKPERQQRQLKQHPLPSPEQKSLLQEAKWNKLIADFSLAPFDGGETIMVNYWANNQIQPWWEFLNVDPLQVNVNKL